VILNKTWKFLQCYKKL